MVLGVQSWLGLNAMPIKDATLQYVVLVVQMVVDYSLYIRTVPMDSMAIPKYFNLWQTLTQRRSIAPHLLESMSIGDPPILLGCFLTPLPPRRASTF
jgi:hypothetical protein